MTKQRNQTNNSTKNFYCLSRFAWWTMIIIFIALCLIALYLGVGEGTGYVTKLQDAIQCKYDPDHTKSIIVTFIYIAIIAILYISVSLYLLLTQKAIEDNRFYCIPMLISPLFLVLENGILHIFNEAGDTDYYTIMMSVFSSMVVGVITFASLKFSFELSTQKKRLAETSEVKPNIIVTPNKKDNTYSINPSENECYLCGAFVGKIEKIFYRDTKKTGNHFSMKYLFYPNIKKFFEKNKWSTLDYSFNGPNNTFAWNSQVNTKFNSFIKSYSSWHLIDDSLDFYWIFRDKQNYYYFVQMPTADVPYNVIGVNEYMMTRLLYSHNKNQSQNEKHRKSTIIYKAMDWFKIPYNFYPNNP